MPPDFQLWDPYAVSSQTITNRERNQDVKVCTMNGQNEYSNFNLDHHTAMSLLAGLVRPPCGRAWNYVVDRANWAVGPFGRGAEVAVHCRSSSKTESVDLTQKQPEIICRLEGLINNNASHVVVGVTYGLEAFCVFSHQNPQHYMLDTAQSFADSLLRNTSRLDERNCPVSPELKCILYSDLTDSRNGPSWKLQSIPYQYEGCLSVMNHQLNKGIPLQVVLYPIRNLRALQANLPRMPVNQTETSRHLIARCQLLWDRLQQVRFLSNSLITETNTFRNSMAIQNWNLPAFCQKIQEFHLNLEKFIKILLQAFAYWIVSIRQGKERGEDQMMRMMDTIDGQSPFVSNDLIRWINYHKEQIRTLEMLTNLTCGNRLSGTKQVLDRVIQNGNTDLFAVVLHLPNLSGKPDNVVQEMSRYVEAFKENQRSSWTGNSRTSEPPIDYRPLLIPGQEFSDWAVNYNSETENVVHIIFYDERAGQNPFIRLYRCGTTDSTVINSPKAPGRMRIVEKRRGVIKLNWEAGETINFLSYLIQYRNINKLDDHWTSIRDHCQNVISIDFLQPEESYVFRVATVTHAGMSPFSPISDEITVDPVCSPPTNIQIKLVTDSAITLTWDHYQDPQNLIRIISYSVDCWVDGQPTLIQRTATAKEVTIEPLDRDTVYCIQVKAVCMDANGSTFEGPACKTFEVRTKKEAERLAQIVRRASMRCVNARSDIIIHNLTLKPHGTPTPGVDHYVFGELTYLALIGKRRQRTILMVGATGSGKTTLINAMVNYVLGVKWEDEFRFKLIDEQTDKSQAHSQTELITTYDLYETKGSRLEYSLTVVDTPGFGDTRGIEKDNKIYDQIQDYFKGHHGIRQLEAVCFVVEASQPRLTETQQYIFDSILSIFGNDIKNNIRLMVTFADNDQPPVLSAVKEAKIPSPMDPNTGLPLHHKFSSSIFFTSNKKGRRTNEINKTYFDMSIASFDCFFRDLSHMETKSLALTTEVLEERKRLQVLVECLQMKTEMKFTRVNELEKIKKVLTDNKEQMKANKDFEFEVEFHVPKSIDITGTGQFTTNCDNCKMTCHFPCRQFDDKDKNKCSIMDPTTGSCRICNCPWNTHFHQKYRYEIVKEIKTHSLDSIRGLYQGAANEALSNEKLVETIQKEIDEDERQLLGLMQATSPHIQRLDEIALRPHPMSTIAYIDLMIETEKKENRPDIKERIARLQKLRTSAEFKKSVVEKSPQGPQQSKAVPVEKEKPPSSREETGKPEKLRRVVKLTVDQQTSSAAPDEIVERPIPVKHQERADYDLADGLNQMTITEKNKKKESVEDPNSRKPLMKELADSAKKKSDQISKKKKQPPK